MKLSANFGRVVLATFLATAAPAEAYAAASSSGPIIIRYDRGGLVAYYLALVSEAKRQKRNVKILGRCDSACTLYLSLPKSRICISPEANFGFHAPYNASPEGNAEMKSRMLKEYPRWVKNWISRNGGLTNEIKRMYYEDAQKYVRTCPK